MKGFRFRLETVLRVRRKREELELEQLQRSTAQVRAIESDMDRTRLEQRQAHNDAQAAMQGSLDVIGLRRSAAYGEALVRRMETLEQRRRQAEANRETQRLVLLEAVRKRKVLETLRGKALADFVAEAAQQEQKQLDDWTVTQHARPDSRPRGDRLL